MYFFHDRGIRINCKDIKKDFTVKFITKKLPFVAAFFLKYDNSN